MSNTKLTADSKQYLKEFKKNNSDIRFFNNGIVTIAYTPEFTGSKMARVAISIMSDNEKKFRAKVGEYNALTNLESGIYITVPCNFGVHSFMDTIA